MGASGWSLRPLPDVGDTDARVVGRYRVRKGGWMAVDGERREVVEAVAAGDGTTR